jgi:hypothetical protein
VADSEAYLPGVAWTLCRSLIWTAHRQHGKRLPSVPLASTSCMATCGITGRSIKPAKNRWPPAVSPPYTPSMWTV